MRRLLYIFFSLGIIVLFFSSLVLSFIVFALSLFMCSILAFLSINFFYGFQLWWFREQRCYLSVLFFLVNYPPLLNSGWSWFYGVLWVSCDGFYCIKCIASEVLFPIYEIFIICIFKFSRSVFINSQLNPLFRSWVNYSLALTSYFINMCLNATCCSVILEAHRCRNFF